jgi:tRNA-modifying protein YgfZ
MSSPLLALPGAVVASGVDAGVAAHYGSFDREQRILVSGEGFVDLSDRDVVSIAGPARLEWLHSLTTQQFADLAPRLWTTALILSPQGHVEHAFTGYDDGSTMLVHTEPGRGPALIDFLQRMQFMLEVTVSDATAEWAVVWRPNGFVFVPRTQLTEFAKASEPACGLWAYDALRIARGEPRFGLDTDHRTIPNEMGWIGSAVHLDKGCYRGQETVARVHTLGRPPRRLTLVHLDGSENRLPPVGADLLLGERVVGFVGGSARHYELGPIALGLVKRNVGLNETLTVDGMPASQEVIVDPEIGLHVRPKLS